MELCSTVTLYVLGIERRYQCVNGCLYIEGSGREKVRITYTAEFQSSSMAMEKLHLVFTLLFWSLLRVSAVPVSVNLEEERSSVDQSKEASLQAVGRAVDANNFHFILRNALFAELYYFVKMENGKFKNGFVARGLEKCVDLEVTNHVDSSWLVYLVGYVRKGAKFEAGVAEFRLSSGTVYTWGDREGSGLFSTTSKSGGKSMEKSIPVTFYPLKPISFVDPELLQNLPIVPKLANGLSTPIYVSAFCTRLVNNEDPLKVAGEPGPVRQMVKVVEHQCIQPNTQEVVNIRRTWIEFRLDNPWVIKVRGSMNGDPFFIQFQLQLQYDPARRHQSLPTYKLFLAADGMMQLQSAGTTIQYTTLPSSISHD